MTSTYWHQNTLTNDLASDFFGYPVIVGENAKLPHVLLVKNTQTNKVRFVSKNLFNGYFVTKKAAESHTKKPVANVTYGYNGKAEITHTDGSVSFVSLARFLAIYKSDRVRRSLNVKILGTTKGKGDCYVTRVAGSRGETYYVKHYDTHSVSCSCPDHSRGDVFGLKCKHQLAVERAFCREATASGEW